jgi:hypothetical protein
MWESGTSTGWSCLASARRGGRRSSPASASMAPMEGESGRARIWARPGGGACRPPLVPPSPLATAGLQSWRGTHRGSIKRACCGASTQTLRQQWRRGPSLPDDAKAALLAMDAKDGAEVASSKAKNIGTAAAVKPFLPTCSFYEISTQSCQHY